MTFHELYYRCGNMSNSTYLEIRRINKYIFAGYIKDMPDIYKYYKVYYFKYIDDNTFEIVLE